MNKTTNKFSPVVREREVPLAQADIEPLPGVSAIPTTTLSPKRSAIFSTSTGEDRG